MSIQSYPLPTDLAQRAVAADLMDPHVELIIDGPRVRRHEVEAIADATYQLLSILRDACNDRYAGSLEQFGAALGHSPDDLEVYRWDQGSFSPETYARTDVVKAADGFKIVEFNIGSSVGGLVNTSYPWVLGLPQLDAPLLSWAHHIGRRIAAGSRGVLVEDEKPMPTMRRDLEAMAATLSRVATASVRVCSPNELEWNGEQLRLHGETIDWVYPLFYPVNVRSDERAYAALRDAMRTRRVAAPISHVDKIFGSKVALAILHDMAAKAAPESALRKLVDRWVAWSAVFDESRMAFALKHQQALVLKPALGFGGYGVVIGGEQSPDQWRRILLDALEQSREPYILQRFHPPLPEPVTTVHYEHGLRSFDAHSVWGIYVAGGKAGGSPLLRCRPVGGSAVINLHMGGSIGALPML